MQPTGQALTPAAVLRNENDAIDLSSDDDLGDDALEQLIKRKQEAKIFNDLPLLMWRSCTSLLMSDLTAQTSVLMIFSSQLASASPSMEPLLLSWLLLRKLLS